MLLLPNGQSPSAVWIVLVLIVAHPLQTIAAVCNNAGPLPSLPSFPTASYPYPLPAQLVTNHWSNVAKLTRPPRIVPTGTQTNCPHLAAGLLNWNDTATWPGGQVPGDGANVILPENTSVLVSSCSIAPGTVFGLVTIPATSSLVFDDAPISFDAKGILVSGSLRLGSETCRLRNKVTITLHGKRSDQVLPGPATTKGINVTGAIEVHGVQYTPTWTRLAATAQPGNTWILIQDCPNWQPGQKIVVTTTELKDSRDWHRNEQMIIQSMAKTSVANVCAVNLTQPLQYLHYGGKEYQAEVALLSRNIVIQGDDVDSEPTDTAEPTVCTFGTTNSTYPCPNRFLTGFGAHIIINGLATSGKFSGLELFRVGQTNTLGRYPIHFHMLKNLTMPNRFFVKDSSVHHSFFRCFAVHGTYAADVANGVLLQENTAYDAIGHCYFFEDGVEEGHSILYNQGALIHPLGPYYEASYKIYNSVSTGSQSFGSQYQAWYDENDSVLLLPSDISASVFYFTNSYNKIVGNAASGGANGFAFPSLASPVKLHEQLPEFQSLCPRNRPLIQFQGNSAHSTGFWQQFAAGVYIGGQLMHTTLGGPLTYTAGRSLNRDTCLEKSYGSVNKSSGCPEALQAWMRLEDTKVFLANRGIQHWGTRSEIYRFEGSNLGLSMNVFGQVHIDSMWMDCRATGHLPKFMANCRSAPANFTKTPRWGICNERDWAFWTDFNGFQFYDTGQQHIVTNSAFRNCNNSWQYCIYGSGGKCGSTTAPFLMLTHSNQFVPAQMQATRGIKYGPGIDPNNLWTFSTALTSATGNTVAGRLQSWYDADGSASLAFPQKRVMMGSMWAGNDWWKCNAQCVAKQQMWVCPMAPLDSQASIYLETDASAEDLIGTVYCGNGTPLPCPFIANVTHFGRSEANAFPVALNARITGPIVHVSSGWFIRFPQGTPKTFYISDVQVSDKSLLQIAVPYPAGTKFIIKALAADWCKSKVNPKPWDAVCEFYYRQGASLAEVRTAKGGDVYYFDGNRLFLRVVERWSTFGTNATFQYPLPSIPVPRNFSRGGLSIVLPTYSSGTSYNYKIQITATTCPGDRCDPQPQVTVPKALFPPLPKKKRRG